jgi:hypothetical protein
MFGLGARGRVDDRIGNPGLERLLPACVARAELVERDTGDDRSQPRAQVLDLARVSAADAQPGLLQSIIRLAERAEHPVGDRSEMRPVPLELPGEPFLLIHVTFLSRTVS